MDFMHGDPHGLVELSPTVSGRAVILSYGSPDVIRQAKLEALEMTVRRKMLEQRSSLNDPHALQELIDPAEQLARARKASCLGQGGREQVQALVVPPTVSVHGEEIRGSSQLILSGQQREYQRPAPSRAATSHGSGPMPRYRTTDPAKNPAAAEAAGNGAAAVSSGKKNSRPASSSSGYGMGWRSNNKKTPRNPLAAQLSDGMLTYVPSKFERPTNVVGSAFVPQAQAMQEALQEYDSRKPRRPVSAPMRRYMSQAAAGVPSRNSREAAWAAEEERAGGGGGMGTAVVSSSGMDGKWQDVPVVKVQETDLLAQYRRNSYQPPAAAAPEPAPLPAYNSSRTVRATVRSNSFASEQDVPTAPSSVTSKQTSPKAASAAGAATAATGISVTRGSATATSAGPTGSSPAVAPSAAPKRRPHPVMVVEPHEEAAAEEERRRRANTGSSRPQAWGSSAPSPPAATAAPPGRAANNAPRMASDQQADKSGTATPPTARDADPSSRARASSSSSSSAAPRAERSKPCVPRPPTQRRASTGSAFTPPAAAAAAAANRSSAAAAAADSSSSSAASPSGGYAAAAAHIRVPYQPVNPETRRLQQSQSGSCVATAKTNRLRGPPARSAAAGSTYNPCGQPSGGGGGGSLSAEGSLSERWATPCSKVSAADDRAQLQERILDGFARQYTAAAAAAAADAAGSGTGAGAGGEEGGGAKEAGTGAGVGVGAGGFGAPLVPHRKSSRLSSVDSAMEVGGMLPAQRSVGGGFGAEWSQQWGQQWGQQPAAAASRRVRPPSAGSWAGRPDPDALRRRRTAQVQSFLGTGMVYDPEMQPSPLESYMSQMAGSE